MRITGGREKGKTVQTVKSQDVRPTSSKVRESIFNIIQLNESGTIFYEGETIVLDLFAGSGIMGLESLSRGAKKVVFVEKNARHAEIIKKNIHNFLGCQGEGAQPPHRTIPQSLEGGGQGVSDKKTKLIISDALKALETINEQFNFIFVDPPYDSGLYEPILKKIEENNILQAQGIIVLEHPSAMDISGTISRTEFKVYKTKIYGDTGITVLLKNTP